VKIGLVADSQGDVDALERACDLLQEKGAERIFFLGGRWSDLDELFDRKRKRARRGAEYSDNDFLADVASFVARSAAADGGVAHKLIKDRSKPYDCRFERVAERGCAEHADAPRTLPELVGDRIACLVHDKADLTRDDIEAATFLFHGASAVPGLVQIGTRFFASPGSVSGVAEPSFALLSWEESGMELSAFALDGHEIKKWPVALATRRKMSAR
jgi:hypothetical protein